MSVLSNIESKDKSLNKDDWVISEAQRCLSCFDPPCQKACPAAIPIPEFIRSINSGNFRRAARLVREANPMAASCGAVCPQEVFCQSVCTRVQVDGPLKIRDLHSFASLHEVMADFKVDYKGKRVAIIGAGPAGLSCAVKLTEAGFDITIFDKSDKPGGIPGSSIPIFRLPAEIIESDIAHAVEHGMNFRLNHLIEDPLRLLNDFDAIFIAPGLHISKRLEIRGEELPQVFDAISFLEQARSGAIENLTGQRVVVVGGGNVSLDVAATAANLGAVNVCLLYRRGPAEMRVWRSELEETRKRGILIEYLTAPLAIIGDNTAIEAVNCVKMHLYDKLDQSGRRIAMPIQGSDFMMPADLVISAIGLSSDFMKNINIYADLSTSIHGIFAGGDWARGEGTIVEAARDGKTAADAIINYLRKK